MYEIVPFVFLGDWKDAVAVDERDERYRHIWRVLTISNADPNWKGALKNKVKTFFVEAFDLPTEDLLTKLPDCVQYINEAVVSEESVLVHCSYGQSRSPTVVVAYLMWSKGESLRDTLNHCERVCRDIQPNPGFIHQLKMWEAMKCSLDVGYKLFRAYRLKLWTKEMRENGFTESLGLAEDPGVMKMDGRIYKCRKCRRGLFRDMNVLQHELGEGQESFKWSKRDEVLTPPTSSASLHQTHTPLTTPSSSAECTSLFIEPIEWMGPLIIGSHSSLITCPKCSAKLGSFNWAGSQCSCGRWVVPSFQVHKNKVD
jgi:dual specificity phosphatase 12